MTAAGFGIACVVLSFVSMAVLHVIGRQVSPVDRTMSEYAIVGRVQQVVFGVSVLAISAAAILLITMSLGEVVAVIALGFAALGMAITAFAITDDLDPALPEPASSVHGAVHNVGALLAFLGTIVAAFPLISTFTDTGLGIAAGLTPLAGTLFFFATFLFRERRIRAGRRSIHGVGERVALAALWIWYIFAFLAAAHVL
ncbi:DUF998 domain-containing protein [Streptomyces nodosus]